MEILDLRHFASHQLRPLLQVETAQWLRAMDWDYAASAEMVLRYVDAKILPGYAAVERERVMGYVFFVYEGSKGVIGDMFVDPAAQPNGQRVDHRLLSHVIETLQQSPGIHRIEAQLLVHDAGAVAAPFLREGFRRHPRVFMTLRLAEAVPPHHNGRLQQDFEVRPWGDADFQAAAGVITAAYRGHVDSEINDQYCSVGGAMRFLNNIVRFPGCGQFDGGSSYLALHRPSRTAAGVLLCSRVKHDVGHITQVCVLPEYRGRGLGENLIGACMSALQERRFSALTLTVTQANARAVELYHRLGFESRRIFDAFVWEG